MCLHSAGRDCLVGACHAPEGDDGCQMVQLKGLTSEDNLQGMLRPPKSFMTIADKHFFQQHQATGGWESVITPNRQTCKRLLVWDSVRRLTVLRNHEEVLGEARVM